MKSAGDAAPRECTRGLTVSGVSNEPLGTQPEVFRSLSGLVGWYDWSGACSRSVASGHPGGLRPSRRLDLRADGDLSGTAAPRWALGLHRQPPDPREARDPVSATAVYPQRCRPGIRRRPRTIERRLCRDAQGTRQQWELLFAD